MRSIGTLSRWLLVGEWRAHPLRALVAIVAIAVGVAMGFAVHLINAAAFNEFSAAARSLSGQADIQVSAREAWFDQSIYPRLATHPLVDVASPVLEVNAGAPGKPGSFKVIGLDVFRAARVTPGLVGNASRGSLFDTLLDDTIFLSPAAMEWLGTAEGKTVTLRSGTVDIPLRVAGGLLQARPGQRIGVMDIGAVQWRFNKTGLLSRFDFKLRSGVNLATFRASLERELERDFPGRFLVGQPGSDEQESRTRSMSRAYRVNLTVLALVALFTGAFLVFSTQALAVIRRRGQFALMRVLGLRRGELLRQVLLEGASLGLAGSLLGIAAGYGLAAAALHFFGGDLGAGYFAGVRPTVQFAPVAALVFFALGFGVALLGCLTPAWEAARAAPAAALKSGADEAALSRLDRVWPALACLALAAVLSRAPPVLELPLFGYLSIALLLVGGIGLMPRLARALFGMLDQAAQRRRAASPVLALTLARLGNASGQAAVALGGVLASFSLMVAMAIMVSSFRVSLDDWLVQLLPADLYLRVGSSASAGALGPREQAALAAMPGVARVDFLRTRQLSLDAARPPVGLMARPIDPANPGKTMVMAGDPLAVPGGERPAWISEAMVDLYRVQPGDRLELPLGGRNHAFFVAGVWRDYSSQTGTVQIRLSDYRDLTGDREVNDAAIWVSDGTSAAQIEEQVRALPFAPALDYARPGEIRAMSLTIFDRSFAVTYILEAIAIAIGLSGVAATFSAQTLARAKEFGMLRHVGVTRRQVLGILGLEGGALTALGIACGFVLGLVISLILVFVVNPQSFHWSMQLHMPWPLIGTVAAVLLAASVITALVSGRYALSGGPVRAVREDW